MTPDTELAEVSRRLRTLENAVAWFLETRTPSAVLRLRQALEASKALTARMAFCVSCGARRMDLEEPPSSYAQGDEDAHEP